MTTLWTSQHAGSHAETDVASYISGYFDGEGCFSVAIGPRPRLRVGWEVRPSISVSQNADRSEVLELGRRGAALLPAQGEEPEVVRALPPAGRVAGTVRVLPPFPSRRSANSCRISAPAPASVPTVVRMSSTVPAPDGARHPVGVAVGVEAHVLAVDGDADVHGSSSTGREPSSAWRALSLRRGPSPEG